MGVWVIVKSETFHFFFLLLTFCFNFFRGFKITSQPASQRDVESDNAKERCRFKWCFFCEGGSPTEALDGGVRVNCHRTYARDGDNDGGDDSHLTKSPMEALQW